MATQDDVRRLALSLPGVAEDPGRFAFSLANGGRKRAFAWVCMERQTAKGPRAPRPDVLAIRVASVEASHALIGSAPDTFFTEPHYHSFPAVLAWLDMIPIEQLEELLLAGWMLQAPKALATAFAPNGTRAQSPRP